MKKTTSFNPDEYLKKKTLDKEIEQVKSRIVYKFYHYDYLSQRVLDTIMPEAGKPQYVIYDLKSGIVSESEDNTFITSQEEILQVPPYHIYKKEYQKFILPNAVPDSEVDVKELNSIIDQFLMDWFEGPYEMVLALRCFIKYTMRHEIHWIKTYIHGIGDKDTGKTRFAQLAAMLCNYGYFHEGSMSAASLVRLIDMSGCTAVLDEGDFIDYADKQVMRNVMRAGYHDWATYTISETIGRGYNFVPRSYNIGYPKMIITREHIDDDALASRMLALKFIPQDVPDRKLWGSLKKNMMIVMERAKVIKNLLLTYRWQSLKEEELLESIPRIPDLSTRFSNTLEPILYEATEEEKVKLIEFFRIKFEEINAEKAEQEGGRIMEILMEIKSEKSALFATDRILLKELVVRFIEKYGSEYPEGLLKSRVNSRRLAKTFRSLGFTLHKSRESLEFDPKELDELLPKFAKKYNFKITDNTVVDNPLTDI